MNASPLRFLALPALLVSFPFISALSGDTVSLIGPDSPGNVWTFNNGREFPGATGSLSSDPETTREGNPSLKLVGDFTGGGGYVQAGRKLDDIDIREITLWVRGTEADRFTLRLGDASGQTHQLKLKTEPGPGWKRVVLPLEDFFRNRGKANAVTTIANYESWGGAKDGNWHGPARAIYLLLANGGENKVRTLWLNDITILPKPRPVAGASLRSEVPLSEIVEGIHDWRFSLGKEFKGARGSLEAGDDHLTLSADFSAGGAYVAAIRDLDELGASEVPAIRMELRSENARSLSVQLVDATGQTHQRKGLPVNADGDWHDFELIPGEIAGGEHWGGANDGRWHDPPRRLVLSVTTRSDPEKKPELHLRKIRAEAVFPVFAAPPAFESGEPVVLSRSLEKVNEPASVTVPAFDASPGQWKIGGTYRSELHSPDNSYNAVLDLLCLNADGETIGRLPVLEVFGKHAGETLEKIIELPAGTVRARFQAVLNKTYGTFEIRDLSAAYLAPAPRRDNRIKRILFSTAQVGNLLFPEDSREIGITVEARKPLPEDRRTLSLVVRDYWGAEHTRPLNVALGSPKKEKGQFVYETKIDLGDAPLETGRYYELHAELGGGSKIEPFRNHSSLAILPEAVTRKYDPMEVPFTARNWDNRISDYIRLTDRLGIRICGLWGGWSSKPPFKAQAPGLELCRKLGMGWLTTTPIKHIERGKDDEWSEEALRQGARNFLEAYGDERPLIINLGNEPHGTGDRVRKNVEAYRIVYQAIKEAAPEIPVVATSVEPNEEYFKNGYGQWCDAYDFHIYEHYTKVRRTMEQYRALMEKYGVVKPIWSTELGLNSQGQPRRSVSLELIKKFATFFAAGGENVSWFGLLYPDRDGTSHGSSGDSHNVFDCRFNRYAPRLDAVTYYHAVNAIAIKKFVEERQYDDGTHAHLFRDREGQALQILWNDSERRDVFLPLEGAGEVRRIRIDGSLATLNAREKGISLTVSADPVLLLYAGGPEKLAGELGEPEAAFLETAPEIGRGKPFRLSVRTTPPPAGDLTLAVPPFWKVTRVPSTETAEAVYETASPGTSEIREAEFTVTLPEARGEIHLRLPVR